MTATDREIAATMRRLIGQVCTPGWARREAVAAIKDRRLMVFHEWPSGHWALTDAGREFLAEHHGDAE